MARARVQVRVETAKNPPPWYGELFRELFPEEWRDFMRRLLKERGATLMQTFAESEVELVRATAEAPPVSQFFELVNAKYFPLSDCWIDWIVEEDESEMYGWHEIPIDPLFYTWEVDAHDLLPVFQTLATLEGDTDCHERERCAFKDCPLRTLYLIAANELHRPDRRKLASFCRREKSPLRHFGFALDVLRRDTSNIWFDYTDEMYGQTGCEWNAGMVRWLKGEYDKATKLADGVIDLNDWLREDVRRVRDVTALWRRCAA